MQLFYSEARYRAITQAAEALHSAGQNRREEREFIKRKAALKLEEVERLRRATDAIVDASPVIDAMSLDGGTEVRQFPVDRSEDLAKHEARVSQAEQELAELTRQAAAEDVAYETWGTSVRPLIAISAACKAYIERHKLKARTVAIADVGLDMAPSAARAKLQAIREQIAARRNDRASAESACCSEAEAVAAIERGVASLRNVDPAQAIGPAHLVMRYLQRREDAAPALATFFADQIHTRLLQETRDFYAANGPGLSAEERAARIAETAAHLSALEVEEEHLIRGMIAAGLQIQRRPDADPAVLLDVGPAAESEQVAS